MGKVQFALNLRTLAQEPLSTGIRLASHSLHVYRHVDIEKLQCKAKESPKALISGGARPLGRFSKRSVFHAKAKRDAMQRLGDRQ